jgi:dipeptidyl aminopeptidase/acylaminoacyl peptidase
MKRALLCALALTLPSLARAEPAAPIPMRDFFRNPDKTGYQLSPDGKWLAFRAPWNHRINVWVQPTSGGDAKRVTSETERDIAGFFWKGSGHLVYLKDFKGDENFHLVVVDRDGKNLQDLTPFPKVRTQITDDLADDDHELLIETNKRKPEVFDVFRINVDTKVMTPEAENPGNITGWIADHKGHVRAATTSDGVNTSLLYRADDKQPWKTVLTTNFRETVAPMFFTFDDKQLYVSSNRGRDKQVITTFDPATGKEGAVLFEHPEVDVDGLEWSHKRKVLTSATFTTWKIEHHYFDAQTQKLHDELVAKLPGYDLELTSQDRAERMYIVTAYNDRTRGSRYLYDARTRKLTKLADVSPWLDEKRMATMKPIKYTTRDGLTINGYLTLPNGSAGKGLPMVVNPHGGPWARDGWYFNPEVQFLASRGYAVLQMNFRGSTGYGRKFWEASFKQWGKKMQDDISDGVKYVVGEGVADPRRVCIYGGSYGGYATLAGLAFSPELYACGVDYVGVANLFTWMKAIPPYWKPFLEMMHEMVGDPEKDKALMTEASPVFHADRIRVPVLVAQGRQDPRVPIGESNQMVEALKKRGIDVQYMIKDNEGHGFHNEENRFDFYDAMEKFLDKHLHPTLERG